MSNMTLSQPLSFARVYERMYYGQLQIMVVFVGSPNDEEASRYLTQINKIYEKKCDFTILYDASNIGHVPRKYFLQQVQSMRDHDKETSRHMQRCVIIVENWTKEVLLKTIFTIKPSACRDLRVFHEDRIPSAWWYLYTGEYLSEVPKERLHSRSQEITKWKVV